MSTRRTEINKYGFGVDEDMAAIARTVDATELARTLQAVIQIVLLDEPGLLDELSDDAQADFAVPLGMSTSVLEDAEHTTLDLVAAACTVRYCGEPHLGEFPAELAELVRRLPK